MIGAFVLTATSGNFVRAAGDWTLTTADFRSRPVELKFMTTAAATVVESPATQPSNIDGGTLLGLSRTLPSSASVPPKFEARLRSGDRLAGQPEAIDGENLRWHEQLLGSITVPLKDVIAIVRSGHVPSPAASSDDVAMFINGDAVHGAVNDLNDKTVGMQRADGTTVPVPVDSLAELRFASTGDTPTTLPTSADGYFRVTLQDGTRIAAGDLNVSPPTVSFTSSDHAQRQLPLESLLAIDHVDGPVRWLSSMTPTESLQTPLLDRPMPARFDRSVTGGPIQFGDRTYQHGIGVHAYSRLSFTVGPNDKSFRTQFAIDGDAPYAEVTVRIKLDGQVASETAGVRAGTLSPVITLDVSHAHTLTLEVEDPTGDNIQGRLNWIEPAMVR